MWQCQKSWKKWILSIAPWENWAFANEHSLKMQKIIKQVGPNRQLFETVNFAFMKIFNFLIKTALLGAFLVFLKSYLLFDYSCGISWCIRWISIDFHNPMNMFKIFFWLLARLFESEMAWLHCKYLQPIYSHWLCYIYHCNLAVIIIAKLQWETSKAVLCRVQIFTV